MISADLEKQAMAESAVKEKLKCSICLDNFKNPKVLPCCHSFCLHCLEEAHEKTQDNKNLTCPECKANHQVSTNGPRGFPDDYTLANQKHAPTTTPVCEQCGDKTKPVEYSDTCSEYLCEECLRAPKKHKGDQNHETVIKDQSKKSYLCSVHPEEPLRLYCKSCKSLACFLCFVELHNGHENEIIDNKIKQEVEQSINNLVKVTDLKLKEFEESLKYVSALETEKAEASITLKTQVDKEVHFLTQQLEARRKELHKEIDDTCTKDLNKLCVQKEYHETAITSMEDALSFARRALACKEDTELLALCKLKELSQLKWDSQETEEIEITTIEFKYPQEREADTAVGKIQTEVHTPDIQITTEELHNHVQFSDGCSITFQVTAVVNFKWKSKTPKLTASATYRSQQYKLYENITEENATANSWTVKFTPKEPSIYTITFQVNGDYGGTCLYQSAEYRIEVYNTIQNLPKHLRALT